MPSCQRCRKLKERCEGFSKGNTCERCRKAGVACEAAKKKKRGRPKGSVNKTLRKKARRAPKQEVTPTHELDNFDFLSDLNSWFGEGLVGALTHGVAAATEFGLMGVEAVRDLTGDAVTRVEQRIKHWSSRMALKTYFGAVPCSDETIEYLHKKIPDGKVGFVYDGMQPFGSAIVRYTKAMEDLLYGGKLILDTAFFNDSGKLVTKDNGRLPPEGALLDERAYKIESDVTMGSYYLARKIHIHGALHFDNCPQDNVRACIVWADEIDGPRLEAKSSIKMADTFRKHFKYKRVRELPDWEHHVSEFVQSIPHGRCYAVVDLLHTDYYGGVLRIENNPGWYKDDTPPTTVSLDTTWNMITHFTKLFMGRMDFSKGWKSPDTKFIRNNGSGMYCICSRPTVWMPKSDSYFSQVETNAKVCCFSYEKLTVYDKEDNIIRVYE